MKIASTSATFEGVSDFLEGDSKTSVHVAFEGAMEAVTSAQKDQFAQTSILSPDYP